MNKNLSANNTTNNITNNNNLKEGVTMNITRTPVAHKTTVELVADVNKNGTQMAYIAINGVKIGVMGYSNEADRKKAETFLQKVVDNSTNEGVALYQEIMDICMTGAAMAEENITASESEEVEIEGVSVILNYEKSAAYVGINKELHKIANLDDMEEELPYAAVKALLIERAKNALKDMKERNECYYYDEDEDVEEE